MLEVQDERAGIFFLHRFYPVFDSTGQVTSIAGYSRDITERVIGEEILRTSKARLSLAMEMARLVHWEYEVKRDLLVMNDEFYALLGTTASQEGGYLITATAYMQRFVHPEDIHLVEQQLQDAVKTCDSDFAAQMEYRIICRDGEERVVLTKSRITKDANGNTTHIYGINQEITERKRIELEIKKLLAEKELLVREVHHRIKNNLNTVQSLLSLQTSYLDEPAAVQALEDAVARIRTMAAVYEQLYRSKDVGTIPMQVYFSGLIDDIAATWQETTGRIRIEKAIANREILTGTAFPIGIIVNELITNAQKYAFPDGRPGTIRVSLLCPDEQHLEVHVADDGLGLPDGIDIDHPESFGMIVVQAYVGQLHGTLEARSARNQGTDYRMIFPMSA
jgi:PAS domain S-box-containing protein